MNYIILKIFFKVIFSKSYLSSLWKITCQDILIALQKLQLLIKTFIKYKMRVKENFL